MSSTLIELARHGRPLSAELVIDAHAHVGPYPSYYIPFNTAAGMVHEMDRLGIRLCWAFPFMLGADWRLANNDVIAAAQQFAGRLWGFAAIHPHNPNEMVPETERCLAAGCVGVKLHPDMHRFDPDAVDLHELLSYLDRHGLICHSHNFGSPATIERYVKQHPRCTFVASHFSTNYGHVLKGCENLFICACTAWGMTSLEQFVADVGAERLLLGSDFPCLDISTALGPLLYADLSDEQKRLILGLNAQKIMDRVNANVQQWRRERGITTPPRPVKDQ